VSGFLAGCGSDDDDQVTAIDTTPPAPPTGLTGTSQNSDVFLTWSANQESDLSSYYVYESVDAGDYNLIAVVPPESHAFSDTREFGHEYRYELQAVDSSDNQSDPSEAVAVGLFRRSGRRQPIDGSWRDGLDP
jgi:fibronectin type 3 domain-containing protein